MRLLLTTDTIGGVWTYTMDLARELARHDVQIALATMGGSLSIDQRRDVESLKNVTVFESRFKLEWMPEPWDDVAAAGVWLLDIADRFHPDVVHLNGYCHGSLRWKSPTLIVAHSCVCSWWRAVKNVAAPGEWDRYRDAVRMGLQSVDAIVAPSQAMLSAVEDNYGCLTSSRVIFNGRDPRFFAPASKEPFIFSAGRMWDEAKNVAALNGIAAEIAWSIFIAGDGGDAAKNLRSLGRLDSSTVAAWLSRASIYTLPARYEPFGLSVLEAALSGCALILGDIDSLREIWGDAAIFVEPNDRSAMLQALNWLIRDDTARRDYANRAMLHAQRYTLKRMASDYLALYSQLMRGTLSPGTPGENISDDDERGLSFCERATSCAS